MRKSTRTAMKVLAIALALVNSALLADEVDDDDPPTIRVTGEGKVSAVPDVAQINVGVVAQAPTADAALAANNTSMARLQATLKERGVAAKDIQTSQFQITPQYSQPPARALAPGQVAEEFVPRIVGYQVSNMVRVTARQIDRLGALLDVLVQGGANQIYGIEFRVDQPDKLLDESRRRAVADARRKAEMLAGEAGVVLGRPLRIIEGGTMSPPRPMMYGGRAMMAAEAAVPVAPGEQEMTVTVEVVYGLDYPK